MSMVDDELDDKSQIHEVPFQKGPLPFGMVSYCLDSEASKVKDYSALFALYQNKEDLIADYIGTFEQYRTHMAQQVLDFVSQNSHKDFMLATFLGPLKSR